MTNNIELLSHHDNFTIGTNSNLSEILANVVKVGTDTSNVTISIPQDISSSYNLILPVRQGASGESLIYGADGQLKWHDTTVLKQVVSVYGSSLTGNVVSTGTHDSPTYLDAYTANITPMADNSKIFVQFKVNYHAALSASNQISFFIKKSYDSNETIFTESLFGPYNAAGGFTGQYISNLVDEALTSNSISYQLGYKINGTVDITDVLGILGYDNSYNNTIVLQEFEGSGSNATSVWNKGSDSNGLYYNEGTVHIGSSKDALGSQNTPGVALELSGNLVGTNATFSGNIYAHAFHVQEAHVGPNTLFIGGIRVLNQNEDTGSVNVYTDQIVSESVNGLTIEANGNIILDPSGTGSIQLNGDVQLSDGNINAETFIGDLSGNVNAVTMTSTTTTTNILSLDGTLTTSNSTRVEGNLIPSANVTYDLGSSTHMWRDVYVGPGSLYVNNKKVIEDNGETINITTDEGQNLKIKTSGDGGQLQIQSEVGGIAMTKSGTTGDITITTSSGGDINMNAYDNIQITARDDLQLTSTTGTIQLKSAVNITHGMTVSNPTGDDIKIDDNLQITGQVKTNEIIEYTTNSGVTIENVLIKDGNVTGQLIGNVTGTISSLSNLDTDDLLEGSINQYYTTARVRSDVSGGTGINYNESTGVFSLPQEVSITSNVQFNNVTVDGAINSGNVTATKFIGDGSELTGLIVNSIVEGNGDFKTLTMTNDFIIDEIGTIYGESDDDKSGYSVSLSYDGTIVAIGAIYNDGNGGNSGHVRVYQYSNSFWTQIGSNIDGENSNDYSGWSVSLSSDGTILAIGAIYNDGTGSNSGHVRVYQYSNSSWSQIGSDIDGEASNDDSGFSVSLSSDGTILAIGARYNGGNGSNSGHVRVYEYSNSSWTQLGNDIDGEASNDESGYSVSLSSDGTIVAIGARRNDGNGGNSGHVRVYQYSNSFWTQIGSDIDGEASNDNSGFSVSLSSDGTRLAIGASGNDGNGGNSGHVRVYQYSNSSWSQIGSDIDGEASNDNSGFSVSLSSDGTRLAIGASGNDGNGSNFGHVRIYEYNNSSWTQLGSDIDGEASNDKFGEAVSISGDGKTIAIGAFNNDENGGNSGKVRLINCYYTSANINNVTIQNGTVTASTFIGDVTGNVSGVLTGSMTMTGHILPDTNSTYDIGSAEYKIRHMYLSNNSLWIGDEHKATINPSTSQLEFRRRKTNAIPQAFITAGINDTSQILTIAGEPSLSNMSLGKWKQVARNLGITINGKTDLEIDPTDIFDTTQTDDWQTTLDVKTIADDVSLLQTSLSVVEIAAANNTGDITNINSSILAINSDISTIQNNTTSLGTSLGNKQDTITSSTDLSIQNLTLTGNIRGPATMTIDPAAHDDESGTLIVNGSLQVLGTTTTINSETLTINDNTIILNHNFQSGSPTQNAGIEIERGSSENALIQWNETSDQWEFYKEGTTLSNIKCNTIKVSNDAILGNVSASIGGTELTVNGNANISYGVCSLTGTVTTIDTLSVYNVGNNSQILIYYTNTSSSDLTINNTITGCKTNLSETLTVSSGSSVLFCLVNINSNYILTVSQLY